MPFIIALSYGLGSIPFSNVVARWTRRTDLRGHGTGTVSASSLYPLAGFGPVAVSGLLDIAKGTVGPLLASGHGVGAAAATAATISGHNWSLFLRGAGGRGLAPALGAMLVLAPEGAALIAAGLAAGRAAGHTGLGAFGSLMALTPLLAVTRGAEGALLGMAVTVPIIAKRVAGNAPPPQNWRASIAPRLLFDRDPKGSTP